MSAARKDKAPSIALGFRAGRGGASVVAVAIDGRAPRLVLSTFLATAQDGDRLSLEPYHVAAELAHGHAKPPKAAVAAVADGRKRQDALAVKGMSEILNRLKDAGCGPAIAALLVNRAGWITDLLEYSLFAPEHPSVAEGLAVRDALRFAFDELGITRVETDEKSVYDAAAKKFRLPAAELDLRLKKLGAGTKPWRKEEKLACLAAWLALSER